MLGIPEEADEIIEIVADPAPAVEAPPPVARRAEPDFPEEALEQIRSLKAQLERKDKQIEQVMEAYRSKKTETEKQRGRIEKTERRRFEQSKGDFIARFVEVLDNLDRAIPAIYIIGDQRDNDAFWVRWPPFVTAADAQEALWAGLEDAAGTLVEDQE